MSLILSLNAYVFVVIPLLLLSIWVSMKFQKGLAYLREKNAFSPETAVPLSEQQFRDFLFNQVRPGSKYLQKTDDGRYWINQTEYEKSQKVKMILVACLIVVILAVGIGSFYWIFQLATFKFK